MKYLLLILLLLASSVLADVEGVKFLRVACDGGVVVKLYVSPQPSDLPLADKLAESTVCPRNGRAWVEKNYWYRAASSSSRSSTSSSAASSSVQSVTAKWTCPTNRVNGEALTVAEIDSYNLVLGDGTRKSILSTSCDMSYIIPAPQTGQTVQVATVTKDEQVSAYVELAK